MDIDEYFVRLTKDFDSAYEVAIKARSKGIDPKDYVEIKPAPDLASRVEGLTTVPGIAEIIHKNAKTTDTRTKLAFAVVKEICTSKEFEQHETIKRIGLAVKVGAAILTEGILVAPTEGIQGVEHFKNGDGSDYIAVMYAGPIRGAGGTSAALSVALADYARRMFNIGTYKPTQDEIERYVEETELYGSRAAHLQYRPSDDDLREIVANCPVCVDGLPTEQLEVSVHINLKRLSADGKEVVITNRVRSGIPLVLCEGIAQKAKKVMKECKSVGLDWDWLNKIIHVEKAQKDSSKEEEKSTAFLEELVAGRPIFSYPGYFGGFRLRYGRSRYTGIASKGFSPATMAISKNFIAFGSQLKIELPGKGCVAVPVDTIEGPFVVLKNGDAMRINDADTARRAMPEVAKIVCLGDMLATYGDFRKSNTQLQPSSYVEELWQAQLDDAAGAKQVINHKGITFESAYRLSLKHKIPIHPAFLYEFQKVDRQALEQLALALIRSAEYEREGDSVFGVRSVHLITDKGTKESLEMLTVPHKFADGKALIDAGHAQALLSTLGFVSGEEGRLSLDERAVDKYAAKEYANTLELVNSVAPFRLEKRSTFVGSRLGRPEKARERLMTPAPHVLYPIGSYGGKERNISTAYFINAKKLGKFDIMVELARYKCDSCKRVLEGPYCYDCGLAAKVERKCPNCGEVTMQSLCPRCASKTVAYEERGIDIARIVSNAQKTTGVTKLPPVMKGVMGMMNRDKSVEPLEKGILRALHGIYIFKDGTSRFDATDVPITHFYPREIGTSIEKLRELGYDKDYLGNDLINDDQLVEMRHQDVILNTRGGDYLLRVSKFVDDMLQKIYGLPQYYNAMSMSDMIGRLVITLSPHTSCGVLNRIIGFTPACVGLAHPYTITARRRNADGDEDTTMLLLDALINFSKEFLPTSTGGTMDAPLILTLKISPEECDDEVHSMEVVDAYPLEFYKKAAARAMPDDVKIELVKDRLGDKSVFGNIRFTHLSTENAVSESPKRSTYTTLKTMQEKIDEEFRLMDMLISIDRKDAARKLILSHFIPDLIGNLHSFSKQIFRCSSCNAKYRRVPLSGKCTRDGGRLLLTISKGGIEKYLVTATKLAERYELDPYIRQRLKLIKEEIDSLFGVVDPATAKSGQFNLARFM